MKLIKSSFEILDQEPGLVGMFKSIERAGRTAYKSEDKITDNSYKTFVQRIIDSKHYSVLEHGTVYLTIPCSIVVGWTEYNNSLLDITKNPYSKTKSDKNNYYITTNYRVIIEHKWEDLLNYHVDKPSDMHYKRVQVRIICDRGISHEFVRHRKMSFTQESSRYCNYSSDKFNNEITCIIPPWINPDEISTANVKWDECEFIESLKSAEKAYFRLLKMGWKPQQARNVLPTSTKTELVITGFISEWKDFFSLRTPESAHPQAREIAIPLKEEFINRNYV